MRRGHAARRVKVEHIGAACDGRERKRARDALTENGEVGNDVVMFESPHGTGAAERRLRDHVVCVAGQDAGNTDDGHFARGDIARHDGLQRGTDMAGDQHRIDGFLRACAVRALAGDIDVEEAAASHRGAG